MEKQFMDIDLSGKFTSPIPAGTIVKVILNGNTSICIIAKEYTKGIRSDPSMTYNIVQ